MILSSKQKFIITSTVSAAAVVAFFLTFLYLVEGVINARSTTRAVIERITEIEAEMAQTNKFKDILEKRNDDILFIENISVDREQPVEFIERLESIANSTHVALLIDPDTRASDEKFLALKVTLEGENQNLLKYVSLLELLPYQTEIDEVLFQRLGKEQPRLLGPRALTPQASRVLLSIRTGTKK